jgi:hypothetical protein
MASAESLEPDSKVTVVSDMQRLKDPRGSFLAEEGMQIDPRKVHWQNAYRSMYESLERDSNVTVSRETH